MTFTGVHHYSCIIPNPLLCVATLCCAIVCQQRKRGQRRPLRPYRKRPGALCFPGEHIWRADDWQMASGIGSGNAREKVLARPTDYSLVTVPDTVPDLNGWFVYWLRVASRCIFARLRSPLVGLIRWHSRIGCHTNTRYMHTSWTLICFVRITIRYHILFYCNTYAHKIKYMCLLCHVLVACLVSADMLFVNKYAKGVIQFSVFHLGGQFMIY